MPLATDLESFSPRTNRAPATSCSTSFAFPSVSARSEHNADTARAAEWVADSLRKIGLDASIHQTKGHPIVVGEWRKAPAGAQTVLVYGHYDVQPAEPLELWDSPPFEPTVRDGKIFARGSVDDKGQLYLHIKALEAHLATRGSLPVNVIVLAEGEEEVGSENLEEFIEANKTLLACDAVVISDSAMFAPGLPSILSSLRGLAYFQIDVQGPAGDLHSGMLRRRRDESGDGARPHPRHDARRRRPHRDPGLLRQGARLGRRRAPADQESPVRRTKRFATRRDRPSLFGEKGYTTLERVWMRPTCEVNGLLSGYTGEGAKTVLAREGDGEGELPSRSRIRCRRRSSG